MIVNMMLLITFSDFLLAVFFFSSKYSFGDVDIFACCYIKSFGDVEIFARCIHFTERMKVQPILDEIIDSTLRAAM